ncbi:Transient receptor putative cation channel sub M member 2 [Desmophyllum pertusum]|uniref:Transient receptor putative cation channel sub M member 2 n=1 Tax=Desmophyllum pertusum TaxID=174260 RepID=A0A9X0CLY8_9CNID|nr:Transient receptor putative cation channel sub M member 2 [Desmophyllum pertusum]
MEVSDSVTSTLTKHLTNKVLAAHKPAIAEEKEKLDERVQTIIQNATQVYKGYVDDLRNTDNAWIETVAMHFHDETREILGDIEFEVDEGAPCVNWQEVSGHINLDASHSFILHKVAELRDANF